MAENKVDRVMQGFGEGLYCSQAMLAAYCDELGLDRETALKISCGMAAGMARLGSTCGAVTGAYLVLGLKFGSCSSDDKQSLEKTFALIREFDRRFTEKHGSTCCRELLGVDLCCGDKALASQRVAERCPLLVKSAAELLEEILQHEEAEK